MAKQQMQFSAIVPLRTGSGLQSDILSYPVSSKPLGMKHEDTISSDGRSLTSLHFEDDIYGLKSEKRTLYLAVHHLLGAQN